MINVVKNVFLVKSSALSAADILNVQGTVEIYAREILVFLGVKKRRIVDTDVLDYVEKDARRFVENVTRKMNVLK